MSKYSLTIQNEETMIDDRSDQKMSLPKKLGVAFVLLSIVGVLVWLIIGLTEARNDLNALKTELTEAEKEGEKLKFEMAESQAKLVQAKHESKEVEQLQNDVKTLENLLVQSQNENEEMEMRIKDLELDLSVAQNDSRNLGQEAQFLSGKLGQLQKEFEQAQVNATILEGNVENGLKMRENEGDSLRNELNVMNSKFIEALKETSLALNRTQNDTKLLADEVHHLKNDLDDTKNVQRMKFAATQSRSELLSKSLQDLDQNLQSTLHKTHSLTQEIQELNEDLSSTENSSKTIENQIEALKNHQKLTFVQDCQHLRFYGFQQNGFYSIDPDGPYNPDNHQDHPSIQVFCDFEQNITKVYHKQPSEQSEPSNHFALDYGSDLAQVKKLVENSRGLCYQEIIYDCYEAPLSTNGINYAWWLDNQGKRQYFLNGAYQNATMKGCALNCNCDDAETSWSQDSGRITADWLLPITGFGFQPYRPSSQMRMTISELICTEIFELAINGNVLNSLQTQLKNWRGTFEIQFEFAVHFKADLTKQVYRQSYYEIPNVVQESSPSHTITCTSLIRFDDFNIEYCSKGQDAGKLKFTANFYGVDHTGSQRKSVEIPLNEFDLFYPVEVTQSIDGTVTIKIDDKQHSLTDTRLNHNVIVKIESNVNRFATLKDVRIKE